MKHRGMEQENWDAAMDSFHSKREDSGGSDAWLHANHPETVDDRRAFYTSTPWHRFRASLSERLDKRRIRKRLGLSLWFSGLGVAASAAVALLIVWNGDPSLQTSDLMTPEVRVKGGEVHGVGSSTLVGTPTLRVYLGEDELASGDRIPADATLHFRVNTFEYDHVVVFSVEEDGRVEPYYPERIDGESVLVGQGKGIPLPGAVRLDGHAAKVRLIAVFSVGALSWRTVRDAAERSVESGGMSTHMTSLGIESTGEASVWFDTYQ